MLDKFDQKPLFLHIILMEFLSWRLRMCLWFYAFVVLLSSCSSSGVLAFGNDTDRLALLKFKDGIIQDPLQIMSSWNDSFHFCDWVGVTCGFPDQRVVILSLESQQLVGSISPSIGNLSSLTRINLRDNSFSGIIPQELGRLSNLRDLVLSINTFQGEIPLNLSNCSDLRLLNLARNQLTGDIPHKLSYLKRLTHLVLGANNLTGTIPPWIGNYSSLIALSLGQNSLHGNLPAAMGSLSHLQFFLVSINFLSGMIPPSLYNISSISKFSVSANQLYGRLPPDVGHTLPNLQFFTVGANNFQGPIPDSFANASGLQVIDLVDNGFTGSVPMNLGSIRGLMILVLGINRLGYGQAGDLNIIDSLSNCTGLEMLGMNRNRFGGELPESIGNLSTHIRTLVLGSNLIHGVLPTTFENLVNLTNLGLEDNLFRGTIPSGIFKLQKLEKLYLNVNRLSGMIPPSIGNLSRLITLFMEENRLEGNIPPSLGNCTRLLVLNISRNNLSGSIPKQVLSLSSLSISFVVAHNSLSGPLPLEIGNLGNLGEIEITGNKFSGEIPNTLASCLSLERLRMGDNSFQGTIPKSLRALRGIQVIDFSHNNLSRPIPEFLMNLSSLEYLDLSFNELDGKVPQEGIFTRVNATMVQGNKKLCGGIKELGLPICSEQAIDTSQTLSSRRTIFLLVMAVILFLLLPILCTLFCLKKLRKRNGASAIIAQPPSGYCDSVQSYYDIFNSTNGFSSESLIGEGSFGLVYRGVLSDKKTLVAIKVLKLQQKGASKSFIDECNALKNIRHRNLIKIINVCSSIDANGNDFKAVIFEFMPNGSLEEWLHPITNSGRPLKVLSLVRRLNIAIEVALALEYLHHCCEETIVHCDLKPSNILLDADMTAHVGDFGLARFLSDETDNLPKKQIISSGLKGSIGYIPPEYGMGGQVSILGDMYSYGVLLLEMFTGRRPTDDIFKDGLSLYEFSLMALPGRILDIIDPLLLSRAQDAEHAKEDYAEGKEELPVLNKGKNCRSDVEFGTEECMVSVIKISLSCCAPSPKDRLPVRVVLTKLIAARDLFIRLSTEQNKLF